MGKQKEGSLQERIQKLIRRRGGIPKKNHGSMIEEPGIPDITAGYHGIYIGIEAKVDDNIPTKQQGIHCRNLWKSGNIAFVAWTTEDVNIVLDLVDYYLSQLVCIQKLVDCIHNDMLKLNIDDGTRW